MAGEVGAQGATQQAGSFEVGGPASVAGALRVLDRHTRTLVKLALVAGAVSGDAAAGVAALHERTAGVLHELSLELGTDAMSTAAEYAATALEAGMLYPGDELDEFLREVAVAARATTRGLVAGSRPGSRS